MKKLMVVAVVVVIAFIMPARGGELSISGSVLTDYVQQLGPDDESGMLTVSEMGLCFEADAGNGVSAAVGVLAEDNLGSPFIEEAFVSWEGPGEKGWSLTVGQSAMPFGMLNTRLISDPLILDADGIAVETILPGVVVAHRSGKVTIATGVYTEGTAAGGVAAVNLAASDVLTCHAGLRMGQGSVLDLDVAMEWNIFAEKVVFDAELFYGVFRDGNMPQPGGCQVGLAWNFAEPGWLGVRLDGVASDMEAAPMWLVATGGSWDLPAGLTAAVEFDYEPESGARALGTQLGLCFE